MSVQQIKTSLRSRLRTISFVILLLCAYNIAHAQLSVDVEGNYIFSIPYNEVRIPAVGGTMIDIAKDLEPSETFTFRLRVNYLIKDRHVISALYAPLSINSSGEFNQSVNYSGKSFAAGSDIRATYKFNSYRLTYRYLVVNKDKVKLGFGLTGKIREANITLKNNDTSADYPDLGFVPLVNFYFDFQPIDRLSLLLEGDALASKQGRAEDIFAGITYLLSENIKGKIGYRILEGGADVKRNYNFAWINYAAIGVVIDLGGR